MVETLSSPIVCASCGIVFIVPADWIAARRKDSATFYCPNGHYLSFREGRDLRRENEVLRQDLQAVTQMAGRKAKETLRLKRQIPLRDKQGRFVEKP